jgi:hypothetical protein
MRIPRVDFTSLNFANLAPVLGSSPAFTYTGPQYPVQRVVAATTTEGEILPISAPYANSSWLLNFHGPALNCNPVTSSLYSDIIQNVLVTMETNECFPSYGYISWTPDTSTNGSLPFNKNGNDTYTLRSGTLGPQVNSYASDGVVISSGPPLSLFVATFPKMATILGAGCQSQSALLLNSTILQCELYNTSYIAKFTYINGGQMVDISLNGFFNDVPYLDSFGGVDPLGANYSNAYNTTLVEMFAYEAVMDAFGRVMVGTIASILDSEAATVLQTNTSVMSTTLSQTKELAFLEWSYQQQSEFTSFWNGLSVNSSTNDTLSLSNGIEEIFRNITISLMSSGPLQ